jgi:isomaltose glucohydrolase
MTITTDLIARHSVDVLKEGQSATGAFIASPAFPTYHYAWLRDGAFCAHALDLVDESEAAEAFHGWVGRSIEAHRPMFESAVTRIEAGAPPPLDAMPPARYTLDGTLEHTEDEPWPNFQVDGYGMWLWALAEHYPERLPAGLESTVELVARYLRSTWQLKSFSCWEEWDSGEHASTLGAAYTGLSAASRLLANAEWEGEAERVRTALVERFVTDGRFRRGPTDERLDGSLLWLSVPFGVFPADDPRIVATVDAIKRDLWRPGGGVYRYLGDTYYGGGEWILLACSLGRHEARVGRGDNVDAIRAWVRAQARGNGDLPEQVAEHVQAPEMIQTWVDTWGPSATPLLWSHAMYLIMEAAVEE